MDIEQIRKSYRPDKIKLLLIGESPPANGKFFYVRSAMTTFTSRPFEQVFDVTFESNQEFINYFKEKDCYLEDLCHEPIDHLSSRKREEKLSQSVIPFSNALKEMQPEVIAIVLRKIEKYAKKSISIAGLTCPVHTLPFPGNSHQNKYIVALESIVREHYENEI